MPSGPFLAIAPGTFPGGFDHAPPGGVCLSAFLFVRNARGEVLLGRYAEDPRWTDLVGLDMERIRAYGHGWTVPASHLKLGEDPRATARRVAREILQMDGLRFGEPRVVSWTHELARLPGERHFDVGFLVDATLPEEAPLPAPPWYAALAWHDAVRLPASAFARGHEDVVAAWREPPVAPS
jgi:ADP-ribose pyrophosphatase YjhB (NUDIX family)